MTIDESNILDIKNFFNVCKDGIFLLNGDFKIELANETGKSLFFLRKGEIIGSDFWDLILNYIDKELSNKIRESLKTGDSSDIEFYCKEVNKWLDIYIYILEGYKYIIVFRDINERKIAELALKESEIRASNLAEELKKINGMKDDFISTLSHELRNLLATISMGLELMDHLQAGSEADLNTRLIVKRQTGQLISLVNDLLDVNKFVKNKIELLKKNLDINNIIKESAEDYNCNFEKEGIKLIKKLYYKPIYMDIDSNRFKQVIGNLLSNALKFTKRDGEVTLKVDKDKDEESLIVEIKDTGIGIDPELLPELFEPFIQIDNSMERQASGLGLGLSVVKGIIDLHGGTVEVKSEGLGKGTRFNIRLPIVNKL